MMIFSILEMTHRPTRFFTTSNGGSPSAKAAHVGEVPSAKHEVVFVFFVLVPFEKTKRSLTEYRGRPGGYKYLSPAGVESTRTAASASSELLRVEVGAG